MHFGSDGYLNFAFGHMPDLSYPFTYECNSCGAKTTVTRADARDRHPDPENLDALEEVLQKRGWMQLPIGRTYCPGCTPPEMKN